MASLYSAGLTGTVLTRRSQFLAYEKLQELIWQKQ